MMPVTLAATVGTSTPGARVCRLCARRVRLRPVPVPGKTALFGTTLAILIVPYATILLPLYILLSKLGMQNTLVGLALVLVMFQLPFDIFMMRNSCSRFLSHGTSSSPHCSSSTTAGSTRFR
jgi:ABC-type spermidine/putrescine transport system permease subunit II